MLKKGYCCLSRGMSVEIIGETGRVVSKILHSTTESGVFFIIKPWQTGYEIVSVGSSPAEQTWQGIYCEDFHSSGRR